MAGDKVSFEEALKLLEGASNNLKKPDVSLDDAIKNYEEGIKYYKLCSDILKNAEQRIESINK